MTTPLSHPPIKQELFDASKHHQDRILRVCRSWLLVAWIVVLTSAGSVCAASVPALEFDWSMPDRFGLDANQDGLIDYFKALDQIAPSQWTVNFEITRGPADAITYEITVDGVLKLRTGKKAFSLQFPAEDAYVVQVASVGPVGQRQAVTHRVVVQDWLIIGLGDSYASGEGNPDLPIAANLYDDYNRISGNLSTFQSQLATAAQVALARKSDFDALKAQTAKVRTAQQAYNSAVASQHVHCDKEACVTDPIFHKTVCVPAPDLSCPGATANVAAKLAELLAQIALLGLEKTVNNIEGRLLALESAAELAWQSAQQLVSNLQNNIALAQSDLANLRSQAKPVWQDASAHRSAWSGQARAALQLERSDRKTSVTFIHLAVSGAVLSGVIDQIGKLNLGGREIDAILISGGGNDAKFGPIIESLIKFKRSDQAGPPQIDTLGEGIGKVQSACDALPLLGDCGIPSFFAGITQSAGTLFAAALPTLPGHYQALDNRLQNLTEFSSSDIADLNSLAQHLVIDTGILASQLRHKLTTTTLTKLRNFVASSFPPGDVSTVRAPLTADLQRIIHSNTVVFDSAALLSPCFTTADVAVAQNHPVGSTLLRLNHLLLAEAFPLDIRHPLRPVTEASRVYLTEYPDASHDDAGHPCQASPLLPGIETPEWAWVSNIMIPGLNQAVQAGATAGGWNFVTGIYNRFQTHGVCASDSWFNSVTDTLTHEGDMQGIAHPNRSGHQAYADALFAVLQTDLYHSGIPRAPRPLSIEVTPPVLKAGLAYFPIPTASGHRYTLQHKATLSPTAVWTDVNNLVGNGEDQTLRDPNPVRGTGFYRVVAE